jgi:hypothetical protein
MSPAQLSYQRYDNFLLGKDFGKLHHPAQILLAKAGAELLNQLSRQRYDNLLTVGGPLFAENFVDDSFANAPVRPALTVVATLRRASPMIWRISSIKTGETALSLSPVVSDLGCFRAIIHSLTGSCRFHLLLGTDYKIMGLGRVPTVLGCGNPFKPTCTSRCTKIPSAFAVGEPATYVQAPKAKGRRNRAV